MATIRTGRVSLSHSLLTRLVFFTLVLTVSQIAFTQNSFGLQGASCRPRTSTKTVCTNSMLCINVPTGILSYPVNGECDPTYREPIYIGDGIDEAHGYAMTFAERSVPICPAFCRTGGMTFIEEDATECPSAAEGGGNLPGKTITATRDCSDLGAEPGYIEVGDGSVIV